MMSQFYNVIHCISPQLTDWRRIMKLKTTITGIALSFCVAVSSITPAQAKETSTVTAKQVLKEASSTAEYVKGLWGTEPANVTSYRELILMLRTGIDCKTQYNNYLNALSECITSDGKLIYADSENAALYAAAIEVLTLGGDHPQSFRGADLVKSFNDYLASYSSGDELNTAISNPYYYSYIIPAVESFADEMKDSEKILALLKDALFSNYGADDSGCGINYWGYSTDTNGKVLSGATYYYKNSANSAAKIYPALNWTLSLQMEDGGFKYDNSEWSTTTNADSTGCGLSLLSSYDMKEQALKAYYALLSFKSTATPGCYITYDGSDSPYAAVDALEGLVSYYLYLNGQNPSPFNVTDEKSYNITFNGNGGTINKKASYKVSAQTGSSVTFPTATRKGYLFSGWYTAKTGGNKVRSGKVTATSDTTYYARWTKVSVKKASIASVKSASSKKASVTIKQLSGVTGYVILYSTKSDFSNAKQTKTTRTSKTISGLKSGNTYFIKVRAYKSDSAKQPVYGSYSAVKKVKVN